MKGKTIFTVLVLILLLAAIPVTIFLVKQQQEVRKRAAPSTTLTLETDKSQPSINETFTVPVTIDTGPNQVIITEMYMTYDPTKVEAVDFVPGTFFTSPNTTGKSIDNTNGRVSLTVFLPTGTTPQSGTGVVAKASFKAKAAGATTVRLTDATLVGAIAEGGKNVLTGSTPVTVTVKTSSGTTLTPTPTGTGTGASSTPTRTPSPTGAGSASSPTPTPTGLLSPTPTGSSASSSPTPTGLVSSPTPTPVPDSTLLALTSPSSGATVSTNLPVLSGTAKAGATVTITITGATTQTGVATAASNGSFTFTPTTELSEGAQSVTLTEQATDGSTRSASSTFTVGTTALPTTGVIENTILLIGIAIILLSSGILLPLLPFK